MTFADENKIIIDEIDPSQPKIVKVLCRNCMPQHSTSSEGGYVTVCIECESFNQRPNKFKCKCPIITSNCELGGSMPSSASVDIADTSEQQHGETNTNIGGDVIFEDEAYVAGDIDHDTSQLDGLPHDETFGSMHMCMFDAADNNDFSGSIFRPEHYFTEANGYSNNSAIFFMNEHEHGHGLKSIVYRCMKNKKKEWGFEGVSDEQANFTLHSALQFYNMSRSEISNICSMNNYTRSRHEREKLQIKSWYNDSVRATIGSINLAIASHDLEDIVTKISDLADQQMYNRRSDPNNDLSAPLLILPDVRDLKDVRRYYTEGENSLVKLLPHPAVKEEHVGACEFAHVSVEEIFNHILGHGYSCHFYRAGYEEDWSLKRYVDLYPNDKARTTLFFEEIQRELRAMVNKGEIPADTRVVFVDDWSDGFEAHQIVSNNDFNSLNFFTLRFKGRKDHIQPFALSFKKYSEMNGSSIPILLMEELAALRTMKLRYWGAEKSMIPTILILKHISNDYPERCQNAGILKIPGRFCRRWGYSCLYDHKKTPSCQTCRIRRCEMIMDGKWDYKELNDCFPHCLQCDDWWSNTITGDVYPEPPGFSINNSFLSRPPNVKLSFKLIKNSLKILFDWSRTNHSVTGSTKVVKQYLQLLCVRGWDDVHRKIRNSESSFDEILSCNPILQRFEDLHVELDMYPSMVMHMFFLGIQKSNVEQAHSMKLGKADTWWNSLRECMMDSQRKINKISIEWCTVMPFSGEKEKTLGVANWQSAHSSSFARISLFQFSGLDECSSNQPPENEHECLKAIQAYRNMSVIWFCLVSHAFAREIEIVSPTRIDHLVRLFLSSCKDFFNSAYEEDGQAFYESKSNYFSLLNCKEMMEKYGSLLYLHEGEDEKFIQKVKQEISNMRYNTSHLTVLLQKLLATATMEHLNKNNPMSIQTTYSRLSNFRVYRPDQKCCISEPHHVLEKNVFVSGIVDNHNTMYICFEKSVGGGISLYPIAFDDAHGQWVLNLWYAEARIDEECLTPIVTVPDRSELNEIAQDHFLLLKMKKSVGDIDIVQPTHQKSTIICHSWKVRVDTGTLQIPLPQQKYMTCDP